MTPPVAPKAGPFALPRDQLGPGPIVCCALFENPYQLTLLLSLPSFSPTHALPLHPIVTVSANLNHQIFHTFLYLNLFSTTIFNFNIVWWVLKLYNYFWLAMCLATLAMSCVIKLQFYTVGTSKKKRVLRKLLLCGWWNISLTPFIKT